MASILRILLIATIAKCDKTGYSVANGRSSSQFGELLKPPPLPISKILPVPFHGGVGRLQRQNTNIGYNYQRPPPPSPSTPAKSQLKFPSPFYKQYNFNFVPKPQPFSTTASPSLFQKVSGWLFPSVQTSYGNSLVSSKNVAPNKKDCNPCNLVPWIPLLKYNHVGAKNVVQPNLPTYGPPSPTALNNFQNVVQYKPQPFQSQTTATSRPLLAPGVPHNTYGSPLQNQNIKSSSTGINIVSSTYGPPSPTHISDVTSQSPFSSNVLIPSTSYELPSSSHDLSFNPHASSFSPASNHGINNTPYNFVGSTYLPPSSSFSTPSPSYSSTIPSSIYGLEAPQFVPGKVDTNEHSFKNDVEVFDQIENLQRQQLPKTSPPTGFRNSYGEPITNTNIFDIPYSYPASTGVAASSKIKTELLPENVHKFRHTNISVALTNPAPFTINKGRNIHTLQPVALPNLSVSPLPPIFNARPFRPIAPTIVKNILQGNSLQNSNNNVQIQESVPLVAYTHSVDYPATFIQSPIIDIDEPKVINQTKAYRNIPNGYVIDEIRDISSQASEDHISATKTDSDSSFESTGSGIGNDLYDSGMSINTKQTKPFNDKTSFADLRGLKDEDVDKFRTDSNLQDIDSPLLYLKPSAPHKGHGNFILAISTPINHHDYEIYDDLPTTTIASIKNDWEESRNDDNQHSPPSFIQENVYQPKFVQIIVPYTRSKENSDNIQTAQTISHDWSVKQTEEYQPRNIPLMTEEPRVNSSTENYNTLSTTREIQTPITAVGYDIEESNPPTDISDLYDVKETTFDIIKLQHTIDEWTQQEYSQQFKTPQRTRDSEKYAKQIPDEFFTTTMPTNYVTENYNYNYDFYDHEVSSSIQHSVKDENINVTNKLQKVYNTIDRSKSKDTSNDVKETEMNAGSKFHIYTAASSFRTSSTTTTTTFSTSTTTTTPAPWDKIQISISPVTKERVYVVTSKPWREPRNVTSEWYAVEPLDSKKAYDNNDGSLADNLPFKSPRFLNRPSFGFTSDSKVQSTKTDSPYSSSWYRSINEMENQPQFNITMLPESSQHNITTNSEENTTGMMTAEVHEYSESDV